MNQYKKAVLTAFLSICLCGNHVFAETEITQVLLDEAQQKIDEACPVRWQDVSDKLVIPTDVSEDIWEDTTDRTTFVTYITQVISDSGSSADPQVLTDDFSTVAAECATARTALLDLLLIKEPNDIILGMRAVSQELNELQAYVKNGSTQALAAKSCKDIKLGHNDSEDGVYWVDFNGGNSDDAVEVYCDMTTDGGGWTFVAFLSSTKVLSYGNALKFFEQPVGQYEPNRLLKNEHYSLGVLPQIEDTEMMVTVNTPDPIVASSENSNGFVRYRYSKAAPAFNFGPIPCTGSSMETAYEPESPVFKPGATRHCSLSSMYWGAYGEYYQILFNDAVYQGVATGTALWTRGTNTNGSVSKNNSAWFYVR